MILFFVNRNKLDIIPLIKYPNILTGLKMQNHNFKLPMVPGPIATASVLVVGDPIKKKRIKK